MPHVTYNISTTDEISEKIREMDGLTMLVKLLFSKDQDVRLGAARALSILSSSSTLVDLACFSCCNPSLTLRQESYSDSTFIHEAIPEG